MVRCHRSVLVIAALLLSPAAVGTASAQDTAVQKPPLATEPMPAQGPGQTAVGNAVTGSAPSPGAPSTVDASQQQQGTLLKPGEKADDMNAAAGAKAQ
jgi:hypothetical protein